MKHQSDNGWIRNWGHFKFISWILNSQVEFRNGLSVFHGCLQMVITSSFHLWFAHHLKCWTPDFPSFETIYSMPKMDFKKCSKFCLKIKVHVTTKFWVLNFHATWWILLHALFPLFAFLLSYSIMVISHLPNSWYPHITFPHGPWVLTRLFPYLTISWSFKI